eukprot:2075801-Prymnesium_polylepis.1
MMQQQRRGAAQFVSFQPHNGLGNRILAMASVHLFACLAGRISLMETTTEQGVPLRNFFPSVKEWDRGIALDSVLGTNHTIQLSHTKLEAFDFHTIFCWAPWQLHRQVRVLRIETEMAFALAFAVNPLVPASPTGGVGQAERLGGR